MLQWSFLHPRPANEDTATHELDLMTTCSRRPSILKIVLIHCPTRSSCCLIATTLAFQTSAPLILYCIIPHSSTLSFHSGSVTNAQLSLVHHPHSISMPMLLLHQSVILAVHLRLAWMPRLPTWSLILAVTWLNILLLFVPHNWCSLLPRGVLEDRTNVFLWTGSHLSRWLSFLIQRLLTKPLCFPGKILFSRDLGHSSAWLSTYFSFVMSFNLLCNHLPRIQASQ